MVDWVTMHAYHRLLIYFIIKQPNLANDLLQKWLVVGASRLESVISLEAFACLEFMAFRSWQISLVERSCSSFCFCGFCFIWVQVRIFLFLPATPTRAINGRSRPMRESVCLSWETTLLQKLWYIRWSIFWASSFVNSNKWNLICNNYIIT
jgi:hypothetical protein